MQLRRLTVRGFKSFADKTDFVFESALTGVVGPNGCGKSNVVDALKWVLGDQRVRSLRGKEMTDVIFKGAEGRDGAHEALVTVTLGDVDQATGSGPAEVTIGRRLNLDKESEYLLNGEVVRLKDVRTALFIAQEHGDGTDVESARNPFHEFVEESETRSMWFWPRLTIAT